MREIRVALAFKTVEAYPEPARQAVVFKLQARAVQAAAPGRPCERCRGGAMRLCSFAQNEFPEQKVAALSRCEPGLLQKAPPGREPMQAREAVGLAHQIQIAFRHPRLELARRSDKRLRRLIE